jgi:hypothetical protein
VLIEDEELPLAVFDATIARQLRGAEKPAGNVA